jgi:hypothetical protein
MDIDRRSSFGSAMKDRITAIWKLAAIAAALSGAVLAWAAFRQARTATRQAEIASKRHKEQTDADRQRRLTESYSRAVEQLASEKIEVRLGGIYTLEQISQESLSRYWTVMETLTAFVRERSQHNYAEFKKSDERISPLAHAHWEQKGKPEGKQDEIWAEAIQRGEPPAADIDAVLTVIKRRNEQSRGRERTNRWRFDLRQAVLKQANLWDAHLEGADLSGAHLEWANLRDAHLEWANLRDAHLEGADLRSALGVSADQLLDAHGDAATLLPEGIARPAHWAGISGGGRPSAA